MIYQDQSKSTDDRVRDLLSRMTIDEKVAQLCCVWPLLLADQTFPDIDRLKKYMSNGLGRMTQFANMAYQTAATNVAEFANTIQKYAVENTRLKIPVLFQNEALCGLTCVDAASFPTPHNLGCTWKPEFIEDLANVIREEMLSLGIRQALAPVMDITTDPRWGRVHETFGEDPYLAAAMSVAFVKGLQGEDLRHGVLSTGKHFLGYGASQGGVNLAAIRLNSKELYEYYGKPFEAAIQLADLASIMVTYCEVNGIPAGANKELIEGWLYGRMGFKGHVVSEGAGFVSFVERFHVAKDFLEAAVIGLEAKSDADTPVTMAYTHLPEAIEKGLVKEDLLDESVKRVLTAKFNLGLFENPFVDTGKVYDVLRQETSIELSQKISEDSIVLLKNDNDLLPLHPDLNSIAVIGPHADSLRLLFSNYSFPASVEMLSGYIKGVEKDTGDDDEFDDFSPAVVKQLFGELFEINSIDDLIREKFPECESILESIKEKVSENTTIFYEKGCDVNNDLRDGFTKAVEAANKSDLVVMAMGDKSGWVDATCGEGKDSTALNFPGVQEELLRAVHATGKPIVLLIFNGRPYANPWIYENIPAVVLVGLPGPSGGKAISNVLFGQKNPGGKLVMTIPRSVGQIPTYYYHKEGSGYKKSVSERSVTDIFWGGYVNEPNTPLFPFGFGLSYTKFELSDLQVFSDTVAIDDKFIVSCVVKNTGDRSGDEVVQLYIRDEEARVTRPVQELIGFKRVTLDPGRRTKITFEVNVNQLGFINENNKFVVQPGKMKIMIGNSADNITLVDEFEIVGEEREIMGNRSYLSKVIVDSI